jgi:hypothetical protein
MRRFLFLGILLVLLLACSGKSEPDQQESNITDRQRDSLAVHYKLPGASAVVKARSISDSAAARAARLDSLTR